MSIALAYTFVNAFLQSFQNFIGWTVTRSLVAAIAILAMRLAAAMLGAAPTSTVSPSLPISVTM